MDLRDSVLLDGVLVCALVCGLMIGLALQGCGAPRESCTDPGATRCTDTRVELCGPDHTWYTASDCAQVVPGTWRCSEGTCEEVQP